MEKEIVKNDLREIANTPANSLTQAQKKKIRDYAKEYGVAFKPKGGCGLCYHDAAIVIYNKLKNEEAEVAAKNDTRRYVLRPGVDLLFGGVRVNEATLTDELAERIIARGFEKKYFIKCE